MGPQPQGGIDQHLDALAAAIDLILQFENAAEMPLKQREEWRDQVIMQDLVKPELPEPMEILLQLQRWKMTFWGGGLAGQPVMLMRELNTCIDAQETFEARARANLEMALAYAEKVASDANAGRR